MASSKDISKIVDDVGYIITNKLKDVLLPIVESRTSTETAILNIPFVQDIMNENRKLKIQVAELETKLAIVNGVSSKYNLQRISPLVVSISAYNPLSKSAYFAGLHATTKSSATTKKALNNFVIIILFF